jgi:hypothetical protein
MVQKLSHEEVLKVCNSCGSFDKNAEICKADAGEGSRSLKEIHHCKKWDEFYHGPCVYQK